MEVKKSPKADLEGKKSDRLRGGIGFYVRGVRMDPA